MPHGPLPVQIRTLPPIGGTQDSGWGNGGHCAVRKALSTKNGKSRQLKPI